MCLFRTPRHSITLDFLTLLTGNFDIPLFFCIQFPVTYTFYCGLPVLKWFDHFGLDYPLPAFYSPLVPLFPPFIPFVGLPFRTLLTVVTTPTLLILTTTCCGLPLGLRATCLPATCTHTIPPACLLFISLPPIPTLPTLPLFVLDYEYSPVSSQFTEAGSLTAASLQETLPFPHPHTTTTHHPHLVDCSWLVVILPSGRRYHSSLLVVDIVILYRRAGRCDRCYVEDVGSPDHSVVLPLPLLPF